MADTSQIIQLIAATAQNIGFPEAVAVEQMRHESGNFRQDVIYGPFIGGAGEKGLAQFIPGTWQRFGSGNPYDPSNSMQAWANYIVYLSGLFGGDLAKILMAYNGGEGNVQRNTVSTRAKNYARSILTKAGTGTGENLPTFPDQADDFSELPIPSLFGLSKFHSLLAILGVSFVALALASQDD